MPIAPVTPCESCRYTTDGEGRLVFLGCVRTCHPIYPPTPNVAQPAKHGTLGMYVNHKCRCAPCRLAMAEYRAKRKAKQQVAA